MSDEPEPHVYEIKLPDDFELLKVIRIGEQALKNEIGWNYLLYDKFLNQHSSIEGRQ